MKDERARLEERIREWQEQKNSVSQADRALELVRRFLDTADTNRELLVSLLERVELTGEREVIIRLRFPYPAREVSRIEKRALEKLEEALGERG